MIQTYSSDMQPLSFEDKKIIHQKGLWHKVFTGILFNPDTNKIFFYRLSFLKILMILIVRILLILVSADMLKITKLLYRRLFGKRKKNLGLISQLNNLLFSVFEFAKQIPHLLILFANFNISSLFQQRKL